MTDGRGSGGGGDGSDPDHAATSDLPSLDVLVVDDEARIRSTMRMCLTGDGHRVETVGSFDEATHAAERSSFDVAFVDLKLQGQSGLDLIPELLDRLPWVKIIVITAHASVESAVEAMKRGASDYLPKPFSTTEVRLATRKIAELRALEDRVANLEKAVEASSVGPALESDNPEMKRVLDTAREVSDTDATVLLRGESGTGKGVLARAIHGWSPRADRPFGVAHCPSFNKELLESELFGHVKGAFTGAVQSNPGRVARCDGGTLLLDEVGELPTELQPKLLRFVQSREYERVGDPVTRKADVRLIAATNRDLEAAVEDGRFREDLYYRLKVIELEVPPLRERPEDVLPLARRFLAHYAREHDRDVTAFTDSAEEALESYPWPGNVRELENVVERAVILSRSGRVSREHLPLDLSGDSRGPRVGDPVSLDELEEEHIRRIVARAESLERAAEVLGIDTSTLWRRRQEYGL